MKLIKYIKHWQYRRLYRKLFMLYAKRFNYAEEAAIQADNAFFFLTGLEWKDC